MYKNGVSIHEQRLCQPYGDDQRKGLDQFKALEYETWEKVLNRVHGVNFGNIYCRTSLLGNIKTTPHTMHTRIRIKHIKVINIAFSKLFAFFVIKRILSFFIKYSKQKATVCRFFVNFHHYLYLFVACFGYQTCIHTKMLELQLPKI